MSEAKTKPTTASVARFISALTPEQRRLDALAVMKLMKQATGESPRMWGPSIVGYGRYVMTYASGRQAEWMLTGFSPRKASLVLYILNGFPRQAALQAKLGKCKAGGGCLYINKLSDVNMGVLTEMIETSFAYKRQKHAASRSAAP